VGRFAHAGSLDDVLRPRGLGLRVLARVTRTERTRPLFDATHGGIEYRYPIGLKYLAERLSPPG
jgi:hypothetical protein